MSDASVPVLDMGFNKPDNDFSPLDEGVYLFLIRESKVELSKFQTWQWALKLEVQEGPAKEGRSTRLWLNLSKEDMRFLTVNFFEALFGVEWPEAGFTTEEFHEVTAEAQGMTIRAIVSKVPHYNATKADAGVKINQYEWMKDNSEGGSSQVL